MTSVVRVDILPTELSTSVEIFDLFLIYEVQMPVPRQEQGPRCCRAQVMGKRGDGGRERRIEGMGPCLQRDRQEGQQVLCRY